MTPFLTTLHRILNVDDSARLLIVHADDLGMCQASISAFVTLHEKRAISSGSVMIPCAWFPAVAALCRSRPDMDIGVHLTLTAEWESYRWRPLTGGVHSPLLDAEGYLPRSTRLLWDRVLAETIFAEVHAQLDRAEAAGIDITHLDDHMAALLHPDWLPRFVALALDRGLPIRYAHPAALNASMDSWTRANAETLTQAEARGLPLFDQVIGLQPGDISAKLAQLERTLADLAPGSLSILFGHPASDTPELRAMTPHWADRAADFEALASERWQTLLRDSGVVLIGFEPLHRAMQER